MGDINPPQRPTAGKVDTLLNKKLEDVEWGEFRLEELLGKATRGKRLKSLDRVSGNLPFVTAGESNEGISAYIGNNVTVFQKNTITIDMFGSAKYRGYKYGGDDHIAVVHTENLAKYATIFVTSAIHKSSYTGEFHYGRNFYPKDADELDLKLPVKNEKVDFDFMENIISEIETEKISKLKAYLEENGLDDYRLTAQEKEVLANFENGKIDFKEFKIIDIFDVNNSGNILSRNIKENSGETPYLCASSENNAVSSYISYDENYLDRGECIFIGGKTFVVTYQEKDFYSNDSHNLILHLKNKKQKSKSNQLFLVSCIYKGLKHKYSWGDSISNRKIQKDKIQIPTKNNQPDYQLMETLISAVHKLVIKDVVAYVRNRA